MNEGPLHASLKAWYAEPGDREEVPVDGRQIDLVRGTTLIEIQTKSLGSLSPKLEALLGHHRVVVVHPVGIEKWVVRLDDDGGVIGRRKSPKRGRLEDAFGELVGLAKVLAHPNFSLEILLVAEDEVRRHEPGRVWRRKGWVIVERRLVNVLERRTFQGGTAFRDLLPAGLPAPFTTAQLAESLGIPRDLAQKMAYCLRAAGALVEDGKHGNARLFRSVPG